MSSSASQRDSNLPDPSVGNDEADGSGEDANTDETRLLRERCRLTLADLQLAAENMGVLLLKRPR